MRDEIAHKRVVICAGSGGVGKTTTSAALAMGLAAAGRRVAVVTIDPARRLATSLQQQFLALQRGRPVQLQPPVDSMDGLWSEWERSAVERTLRHAIIGGPDTVRRGLDAFIAQTNADELMVTTHVHDHAARVRSYEIVSEVGAHVSS